MLIRAEIARSFVLMALLRHWICSRRSDLTVSDYRENHTLTQSYQSHSVSKSRSAESWIPVVLEGHRWSSSSSTCSPGSPETYIHRPLDSALTFPVSYGAVWYQGIPLWKYLSLLIDLGNSLPHCLDNVLNTTTGALYLYIPKRGRQKSLRSFNTF